MVGEWQGQGCPQSTIITRHFVAGPVASFPRINRDELGHEARYRALENRCVATDHVLRDNFRLVILSDNWECEKSRDRLVKWKISSVTLSIAFLYFLILLLYYLFRLYFPACFLFSVFCTRRRRGFRW
jgi:hypothetical protein